MPTKTTHDDFDTVAALLEAARRPEDVFGRAEDAREVYRATAALVHPDRNPDRVAEATLVFAKLSALWSVAETRLADGSYGAAIAITTDKGTFTLNSVGHEGLCVGWDGYTDPGHTPSWIKMARRPADRDLLNRETTAIKQILDASTTANPHFFPKVTGKFRHKLTDGKTVQATVFDNAVGYVSLADVIARYPQGVDPRDMAWIFRRLLGTIGEAHAAGIVHGAVLPHHVMIHPDKHELVLFDWTSSSQIDTDQRTPYLVRRYNGRHQPWYPQSTIDKAPPTHSTDAFMAARTMQALLGLAEGARDARPAHGQQQRRAGREEHPRVTRLRRPPEFACHRHAVRHDRFHGRYPQGSRVHP